MKKLLTVAFCILLHSMAYAANTYYADSLTGGAYGNTATTCNGQTDTAFTGNNGPNCRVSHPNYILSPQGNNPSQLAAGDTLIIDGTSGQKYQMGFGSPNTNDTGKCSFSYPWDCGLRPVPSGPDTAHPTRILGKGYNSGCSAAPQLWGNEHLYWVLNLNGSNNIEVQCLEVTDHSDCQEFGPNGCNRSTYPFGPWASTGIVASDSSSVLLKNINVHGMANTGMKAGRLNNWTLDHVKFVANNSAGWNGDVSPGGDGSNSSDSGTMTLNTVTVRYNGCGETYPGALPYNCYSQSQGGYGDGIGLGFTGANWVITSCDISRNVQDGLDMLYHNGGGTVTVNGGTYQENGGNQLKIRGTSTLNSVSILGNCGYFSGNSITWNSSTFDNCRAEGNAFVSALDIGSQVKILGTTFSNIVGTAAIITNGSGCNGTESVGADSSTTFDLKTRFLSPTQTASKYYASGATGNGDGSCGAVTLSSIASSCTSNGSCTAATPLCGQVTSGSDNCGNICTKTGAACPSCTPNGSCTAASPGCGQITTGLDNCGNSCSKTGAACPTCTPNGSCSAASPSCGTTSTGIDNCGNTCTKIGAACPTCTPTTCNAPTPPCGQSTSGFDNCGGNCTKVGAACPACTPTPNVCSAPTPTCGQVTTGFDDCNNACTKTGSACPVCIPTYCDALLPICGTTTHGTDSCGNPCSKPSAAWNPPCTPVPCTPNGSCSAITPSCGITTTGVDNCGNSCSLTGPACCISTTQCSAPTPICGTTTTGVDNCGKPCSVIGDPCQGAVTYNLSWNNFKRMTIFYTGEVNKGNIVYVTYKSNVFQVIQYVPILLPPTTTVYTISMAEFVSGIVKYSSAIRGGAKVYILNYNNGSYEVRNKP